MSCHPVVRLIEQASFRSPKMSKTLARASLNLFRLADLLGLYHTYETSIQHDKTFALLGMRTDNVEEAGLSPDYSVSWDQLLQRVVQHILGKDILIHTLQCRELAMLSSRGWIIGEVTDVSRDEDDSLISTKHQTGETYMRLIPTSLKPILEGDVVCILKGAPSAAVVRACRDFFLLIATTTRLDSNFGKDGRIQKRPLYDLTLLWDWEFSLQDLRNGLRHRTLMKALGRDCTQQGLVGPNHKEARLLHITRLLYDFGNHEAALDRIQEGMGDHDYAQDRLHSKMELLEKLPVAYIKASRNNEVDHVIRQEAR